MDFGSSTITILVGKFENLKKKKDWKPLEIAKCPSICHSLLFVCLMLKQLVVLFNSGNLENVSERKLEIHSGVHEGLRIAMLKSILL